MANKYKGIVDSVKSQLEENFNDERKQWHQGFVEVDDGTGYCLTLVGQAEVKSEAAWELITA